MPRFKSVMYINKYLNIFLDFSLLINDENKLYFTIRKFNQIVDDIFAHLSGHVQRINPIN